MNMRRERFFNAAIIGMFSWTSYLDGSSWVSGVCAGVSLAIIVISIETYKMEVE